MYKSRYLPVRRCPPPSFAPNTPSKPSSRSTSPLRPWPIHTDETATGEAIGKSGVDRKDIWITSKLWNSFHGNNVEMVSSLLSPSTRNRLPVVHATYAQNYNACPHLRSPQGLDATLRDLGTDYLDLYLMHWPVAFHNPKNSELASLKSQDGRPIENHMLSEDLFQTWKGLEETVKKGKVRNIGISNFNIRRVENLLSNAEIKPAVNQVEVNWGVPNDELLHYCEAHHVKLQAYSPLGSSDYVDEYSVDPVIMDVAKRNNITPVQTVLAWHLARGIQPITRCRRPERLQEALAAVSIELPWEDVQHLTREADNKPIQRVVDPTEAWNLKEDIFEDYTDQTRLMSLKGGSLDVPLPHEAEVSKDAASPYLEPRNDPASVLSPKESVARFHTMAGNCKHGTKGSTVLQHLSGRKAFSASSRAASAGATASASSSFLSATSKQALATPGLQWTDGVKDAARNTRKMNMCTVRGIACRFASSAAAAPPPPSSAPNRRFPARKAFLHSQYQRLLEDSRFMLFLQPNHLSVAEFTKLRADLAAIPLPVDARERSRARLTVLHSGVMRPALRSVMTPSQAAVQSKPASDRADLARLGPLMSGPLAMLTSPSLSPAYVSRLLAAVDKALGNNVRAPVAGARSVTTNPRLVPLAAVIEGSKVLDVPALRKVGQLPDLQTLRAQIVGLLGKPASQLASLLSMAAGGHLALTLEGRKQQLESGSPNSAVP